MKHTVTSVMRRINGRVSLKHLTQQDGRESFEEVDGLSAFEIFELFRQNQRGLELELGPRHLEAFTGRD